MEIPAAAREQTDKGAEAFVRFFFDQFNVAWTEPQAGLISSLSHDQCQFCKTTEETAAFLVEEKQRYAVAPVRLNSVDAFVGAPEGEMYLAASIEQVRADLLDKNGRIVATDAHQQLERNIALKWKGDQWLMLEVEKTD